jgi:hypothetical protein
MLTRVPVLLVLAGLILLFSSCTKISEEPTEGDPEAIAIENISQANAVPSNWGKLISVSHRPDFENVFQLWFQDEDGNIRMAVYNMRKNRLLQSALIIPQR